ncbi:hypothetical protein [Nocardioides terrisoli]|uniref:hypothetical protein n=1 Tax=Nocardioides terrisoli TaxID=3388267 RepID=UPI00287B9CA3|nr:hypothetical protein [Nocardioides marmorisolisilvae]
MHRRLTASFLVMTVTVLIVFSVVRAFALHDLLRVEQQSTLRQDARLVARYVARAEDTPHPVSRQELAGLVALDEAVVVRPASRPALSAQGADYRADGAVSASAAVGGMTVQMRQSASVLGDAVRIGLSSLVVLTLVLLGVTTLLGVVAARLLAAPFSRLAVAATALGRGRFDLDLPETRLPEARAIGEALRASARQLRARLQQDRADLLRLSHEVRTPLTSLRMDLEDLAGRPGLDSEDRAVIARGIEALDAVHARVGEYVATTGRHAVVEDAQVPLGDLAQRVFDDWSSSLAPLLVRGEVEQERLMLTPGPVEQLLDVVRTGISRNAREVVIEFTGADERVTLRIAAPGSSSRPASRAAVADLAGVLGGRVAGDLTHARGLQVWLPRR